jgi:DNA-directed RNA polymerase specialized sigma subunit
VLRFFENRNFREVGAALGASEAAAKMRVNRALEKLRKFFTKRGVVSTTAILAEVISANSVQAAPAALTKTANAMALAKGAAAGGSTLVIIKGALKVMAWTKAKTALVVGIAVIAATGTTTVIVKEVASTKGDSIYEEIFKNPDSRSMDKLEQAPPNLIVRATHYPDQGHGFSTRTGKSVFVGATMQHLIAWAYGVSLSREILPPSVPTGGFDYLATLPSHQTDALQEELKKQFGLVARREFAKPMC